MCLGMHPTGATLMGWLGLVWARGSGLTEVLGHLECLDLAPVYAVRVEGNVNCGSWQFLLTWIERVSVVPLLLGRVLELVPL